MMAEARTRELAQRLAQLNLRLVLAESCTGGKAAALLTEVPGISQWFCGSAVTYRELTKQEWLQVPEEILQQYTAESQEASDSMALGVLARTSEADLGCAITGHLGPGVDSKVDGLVFLSIARKLGSAVGPQESRQASPASIGYRSASRLRSATRSDRQREAAQWMLHEIVKFLAD
jgi:nicotinamide-nucleotide amidase